MATTIFELEENKNAVIIHYPHLYPLGKAYPEEKPKGCCIKYLGWFIEASIYYKGYQIHKENKSIHFNTLREAKQYIIDKYNNERRLV